MKRRELFKKAIGVVALTAGIKTVPANVIANPLPVLPEVSMGGTFIPGAYRGEFVKEFYGTSIMSKMKDLQIEINRYYRAEVDRNAKQN